MGDLRDLLLFAAFIAVAEALNSSLESGEIHAGQVGKAAVMPQAYKLPALRK
jgi:hypothetical protein